MAVVHMSEAEAASNFSTLIQHLRDGSEVVIDDDGLAIARVDSPYHPAPGENPEYDAWFSAEVQKGLDCDPATDVTGDAIWEDMNARRAEALRKLPESQP